jgi:hypothetical protein
MSKIPTTARDVLGKHPKRLLCIKDLQNGSEKPFQFRQASPRCKKSRYFGAHQFKFLELGGRNILKATFVDNLQGREIHNSLLSYDSSGKTVLAGAWRLLRSRLTRCEKDQAKYFNADFCNIDIGYERTVEYFTDEKRDEIPLLDGYLL